MMRLFSPRGPSGGSVRPVWRRARAQTVVEFALAFPILIAMLLAAIQFGLLLLCYVDEVRLTRDSARWLAVHANTSDDAVAQAIASAMLPVMIGGQPSGSVQGDTPDNHANAVAVYQIGPKLTATFTPCLARAATTGNCTGRDSSVEGGATVHVRLSYDASSIIFLPTRLNFAFISLYMPTALPSYSASMVAG
ncbi:MAG: pilus assembly protein [Chloroflexota bacterium]|nr:pilus assembly protein [Chloroflexota bacterium]